MISRDIEKDVWYEMSASLSRPVLLLYRDQSQSFDWFLCDDDIVHEW